MKRCAIQIILSLIAGALLNVAVALTIRYPLQVRRDADVLAMKQQTAMGMPYSVGVWVFAEFGRHGWPCATVNGIDGFDVVWPGFAVNTLFYAGVLWVLFCGPFTLRRMIRRRRGQCPACAYPIGQSPVCTECGAAVQPTHRAVQT